MYKNDHLISSFKYRALKMIFKSSAHTDFEEVHVALSLRAAIFRCHTDHQLAYMLIFSIPGCNIVVEAEAKIHHHHLYFFFQ